MQATVWLISEEQPWHAGQLCSSLSSGTDSPLELTLYWNSLSTVTHSHLELTLHLNSLSTVRDKADKGWRGEGGQANTDSHWQVGVSCMCQELFPLWILLFKNRPSLTNSTNLKNCFLGIFFFVIVSFVFFHILKKYFKKTKYSMCQVIRDTDTASGLGFSVFGRYFD